jgi:hypothetical protein
MDSRMSILFPSNGWIINTYFTYHFGYDTISSKQPESHHATANIQLVGSTATPHHKPRCVHFPHFGRTLYDEPIRGGHCVVSSMI